MDFNSRNLSYEQESYDRNYILTSLHKNIPSYCLWDEIYIRQEKRNSRLSWWKSLNISDKHAKLKKIQMEWIKYLT